MASRGWIAVDLDATLAHYDEWKGPAHIGPPIPAMVARVRAWLAAGHEVRIFTARVGPQPGDEAQLARAAIEAWSAHHLGVVLPVTATKDFTMLELWDDRAVQVVPNTGLRVDGCPACALYPDEPAGACPDALAGAGDCAEAARYLQAIATWRPT
jgi:hypothetical protein